MRMNHWRELVKQGLPCLLFTLLVFVPNPSAAQQPAPAPVCPAESAGAVGDFTAYAWAFAASVLILASALAMLIAAVAKAMFRAPDWALSSRQWHISLVAGSAALFGVLIAELSLFFALQSVNVTRPAAALPSRVSSPEGAAGAPIGRDESAPRAADGDSVNADLTEGEPDQSTDVMGSVNTRSMGPGEPQVVTIRPNERRDFELTVPSSGDYRITVLAENPGVLMVIDENGQTVSIGGDILDGDAPLLVSRIIFLEDDLAYQVMAMSASGGMFSLLVEPLSE